MYDTEIPALRDQQESSVDAWMRAAAYAAGTEPDDDYFVVTEPDNEYFVATEPDLEQINLGEAIESKKRDNLALGEALVSIGSAERPGGKRWPRGRIARCERHPQPARRDAAHGQAHHLFPTRVCSGVTALRRWAARRSLAQPGLA